MPAGHTLTDVLVRMLIGMQYGCRPPSKMWILLIVAAGSFSTLNMVAPLIAAVPGLFPSDSGIIRFTEAEPRVLHFNAEDVARYFTDALGTRPRRMKNGDAVFEDVQAKWPEDYYKIHIVQEGSEVVVRFEVGGDYGMNLAREFFECALFDREESQQLYRLLGEAESAPVGTLPRFSVSVRSWQTLDKVHLVLRFFRPAGNVAMLKGNCWGEQEHPGSTR